MLCSWLFGCCFYVLLGIAGGLPKASPEFQRDDSNTSSMSGPSPPSSTQCLHPDCQEDCSDCEPAEIVIALNASITGNPGESWAVQYNGAKALVDILGTPAAANHSAAIIRIGGIETLLEATDEALAVQPKTDLATPLRSEELIPQLLAHLIAVLGSLSKDNLRAQESIAAHGGIAKIARAMSVGHHRYNDAELVTTGCWALAHLAKNNLENQKVIVGARAVEFAERALQQRQGRTGYCRLLVERCHYAAHIPRGRKSLIHNET